MFKKNMLIVGSLENMKRPKDKMKIIYDSETRGSSQESMLIHFILVF